MKKGTKIFLIILAVVIVLGAGGAGAAWYIIQDKMNQMKIFEEEIKESPSMMFSDREDSGAYIFDSPYENIEISSEGVETFSDFNIINILFIGVDENKSLSDTMIVCSINKTTKEIKLTSFMRDTYVNINSVTRGKLNAAHAYGGIKLLDSALQRNFGVVVDANIRVDFDSFMYAIAQVGDVEIELNEADAAHLNEQYAHQYGWHVEPGLQTLNPQQLLAYSRIRHVGNSDWERTERQRRVLMAAFNKVKTMSPRELYALADRVIPFIETDLETNQILDLIKIVFAKGEDGHTMEITDTLRIPVDGRGAMIDGIGSVLQCDLARNSREFRQFIYGE